MQHDHSSQHQPIIDVAIAQAQALTAAPALAETAVRILRGGPRGVSLDAVEVLGAAFIAALEAAREGREADVLDLAHEIAREVVGSTDAERATVTWSRLGSAEMDQVFSAGLQATDLAASGTADMDDRHHGGGWVPPRACIAPGLRRGTGRDGPFRRWLDAEYELAQWGQLSLFGSGL